MRGPFGCLRGCVLTVAAVYVLVTLIGILLRNGDVSSLQIALLVLAGLVVVGIAFFGSASHWTC